MIELLDWIRAHETLLAWLGAASLLFFFGSLVTMPLLVIAMPEDYLLRPESSLPRSSLRRFLHLLKNALGYLLILAGFLMLLLPGQGLLTIAIGLSLIDFPGKRRLQARLVRLRGVRASIAWIRRKAHKPPLRLPS